VNRIVEAPFWDANVAGKLSFPEAFLMLLPDTDVRGAHEPRHVGRGRQRQHDGARTWLFGAPMKLSTGTNDIRSSDRA
jgi:hypothetical protein